LHKKRNINPYKNKLLTLGSVWKSGASTNMTMRTMIHDINPKTCVLAPTASTMIERDNETHGGFVLSTEQAKLLAP